MIATVSGPGRAWRWPGHPRSAGPVGAQPGSGAAVACAVRGAAAWRQPPAQLPGPGIPACAGHPAGRRLLVAGNEGEVAWPYVCALQPPSYRAAL